MPTERTVRAMAPEDLRRPPRCATRRNPDLRTRGGKIAVLARELGRPLMPHQQYIADVATEMNPPGARLKWRYQRVIISLPRQTGKTTLLRPIFLDRMLSRPGVEAYMTAQMGKDATKRWNALVGDFESSPLIKSFINVRRSQGSERCLFPNRSFVSPFAPGKESLHGDSPPLVSVDEGWAFSQIEGDDLMRAIRPAQQTVTDRQLFIISAAGDAKSEWWNELMEAGRASVDDPQSRTAFFDWSADPDLDPYDPATWEFHPGLDGLITIADLAEEAKPANNSHADFLRGFLNRSTKTGDRTVLDLDAWDTLAAEQATPDPERVAFAYDVAIDRTSASVWAAWRDDDGLLQLRLVETREGAGWVTEYVKGLADLPHGVIAADDGGPTRAVTDELRRAGLDIETLTGKDYSTAWIALKGAVTEDTLRHDGDPVLRTAIEVAVEKRTGDSVAPSRRDSLGPIDPLVSATVAAWYADRLTTTIQFFV